MSYYEEFKPNLETKIMSDTEFLETFGIPRNVEDFEKMLSDREDNVKKLEEKFKVKLVELGKRRVSVYCSICDCEASWGVLPLIVQTCKHFSVSGGKEYADGKLCETFRSCEEHIEQVSELCSKQNKEKSM